MNRLAKYAVLQARPSRDRHEIVTVGLVILRAGVWDVRVLPNSHKLLGLNPHFPPYGLANIQRTVSSLLIGVETFEQARVRLAKHGNDPALQSYVGQFLAASEAQYNSRVSELMRLLVVPPEVKLSMPARPVVSRLRSRLRNHFKAKGLLAGQPEDIGNNKIVEHYPVVAEQGLFAEFAFKNGALNITETIDFDVQRIPRKVLEAQAKTLILSEAAKRFGRGTKRYVIVSGSHRKEAMPSVNLLRDHAEEVFEMSSSEDMSTYFDLILEATLPH